MDNADNHADADDAHGEVVVDAQEAAGDGDQQQRAAGNAGCAACAYGGDEAQEQGKSELQKAQEAAAKAEARAAAMEAEAMRAKVAAATGVDADLLSGSSEEELRASAERLLAWRGAQVPKGAPATDAGVRGDEIRAARQLTREDLKKMSPAEIIKARQDGQLNNIMGIA